MAVYLQTIEYSLYLFIFKQMASIKHIRFNSYKTLLKVLAKKVQHLYNKLAVKENQGVIHLQGLILNATTTRNCFDVMKRVRPTKFVSLHNLKTKFCYGQNFVFSIFKWIP